MEKKKLFFLSTLHILLDSYMGFFAIYLVIAALDPIKSALIITVSNFAGNILQPFMGYGADRLRGKIPIFLGLLLTSVSMSLIGLTTQYGALFILVLFGNLGSSLFHPAGANIAGAAGLSKKDAAFAIFVTIGTIGFALSQPYFSAFTAKYGTEKSFTLAFPAVAFAFFYLFFGKVEIHGEGEKINLLELKRVLVRRALPISLLFFIMVFRTALILSINSFLAKIFEEWGFSRPVYSSANTVFMLSGAAGILAAGHLTDLVKPRKILSVSLSGFLPFFFMFIFFGASGKLFPTMVFLALTGFILNGGHAANIVMGHRVAPEMTSTISGILMGFAWATASFGPILCANFSGFFPVMGGFASGLTILTIFPVLAFVLSIFLSREVDTTA
jgi:FSR family fosmidomycin resistance protein-like MFS transporter